MQGLEAIEKRIKDECNRLFTPVQDFNDFKHRINEDVIGLFKRLQNAEKNIESNTHDIGMHKEQLEHKVLKALKASKVMLEMMVQSITVLKAHRVLKVHRVYRDLTLLLHLMLFLQRLHYKVIVG